jgi:alpha/beta superfamily hydrolase
LARRIESHFIPGPAGRLEALLEEQEEADPSFAALICHPHPQHGGTMHNKVVYRMARGIRSAGGVALRFNYRGVNLSEGVYDHGSGEIKDARACLEWLRERYPSLAYSIAGFSFGARIAQKIGCGAQGADRVIVVGFPTRYLREESFTECAAPRRFVQSTNDEHGPRGELEPFVAKLGNSASVTWIDARDHFFTGSLDQLESAIVASAQDVTIPTSPRTPSTSA